MTFFEGGAFADVGSARQVRRQREAVEKETVQKQQEPPTHNFSNHHKEHTKRNSQDDELGEKTVCSLPACVLAAQLISIHSQ
jgi:hypothetical protein